MTSPEPREGERIAKLLARAGIASRREVERMIADGRVKIGDEVVTTPATVLTSLKGVSVDDKPVKAAEAPRLFVFHKPEGLITAERDPAGRPTIYTALRNALPKDTPRVMPVGRLDLNTEGLLLLTNDGELKRAMELPSSGVPRTYRARTFGDISQAQLEELIHGITIEGIRYGQINANLERRTGRNQWIEMTITEGKNREVRRVLEYLGLQISRLIRTAYGPFELANLPRGAVAEIRQVDVERFRKDLTAADFRPRIIATHEESPSRRAAPASDGEKGRGRDRTRGNDGVKTASERPYRSSSFRDDTAKPAAGRPYRSSPSRDGAPKPETGRPYRSASSRDDTTKPAAGRPYRSSPSKDGAPKPENGRAYRSSSFRDDTAKPTGGRPYRSSSAKGDAAKPDSGRPYRPSSHKDDGKKPGPGRPHRSPPKGPRK